MLIAIACWVLSLSKTFRNFLINKYFFNLFGSFDSVKISTIRIFNLFPTICINLIDTDNNSISYSKNISIIICSTRFYFPTPSNSFINTIVFKATIFINVIIVDFNQNKFRAIRIIIKRFCGELLF